MDLGIIILCTYVHSVAHLIQVKGIEIKLLGTGRRRGKGYGGEGGDGDYCAWSVYSFREAVTWVGGTVGGLPRVAHLAFGLHKPTCMYTCMTDFVSHCYVSDIEIMAARTQSVWCPGTRSSRV